MPNPQVVCATINAKVESPFPGRAGPPKHDLCIPLLQGDDFAMPPSVNSSTDSPAHELAVILRTTLSLLDSYASSVRESSSLRDLERALICAISDLKRVESREHMMPGALQQN